MDVKDRRQFGKAKFMTLHANPAFFLKDRQKLIIAAMLRKITAPRL
jgi:hypothetical protein